MSGTTIDAPRRRWLNRRNYVLLILTTVYALNIADRFVLGTLIEPIKAEFHLSDGGVAFLTGVALAIFYVTAGIPLGLLADRTNRRNMIAWALLIWSSFTLLCGFSQTYWQLLLARLGVGVGEAGGTPPSQSLLADEFPAASRGPAMSIFSIGSTMGAALGMAGAGWLTDLYGWRQGLIVFGAIGLPLALLVRFSLREPVRGATDEVQPDPAVSAPGIVDTLRFIRRHPAVFHVLVGATIVTFSGAGLLWWTSAFLMRFHGLSAGQAGMSLGIMSAVGGSIAMLGTAWVMARLVSHDPRWQVWLVALVSIAAIVPGVVAYSTNSFNAATLALWIFVPASCIYIGPTLALCQSLVPAEMRGQTVAILLFTANIANLVVAPQLIGSASDFVGPFLNDPHQSLRWVLVACSFTGVWGAWHYYAAGRTIREDIT
ncbi:spinster family MFS transporter [Sphingomonas sp. ERG5]|uniref:spinster family MFS transporter n=1 Tax=Sphingomonas sp. ERG5 TaxID=1381597 RepID=UPI0009DDB24C|nr:MFS transporter [Sphingomonas sp. ERG5]